jgi:hypothetical protein
MPSVNRYIKLEEVFKNSLHQKPIQYSSFNNQQFSLPSSNYPFSIPHNFSISTHHLNPATMPQSSCLCGLNRISWTTESVLNWRCHCTDERKLTGAAFALNMLVSTDTLKVESGKLNVWGKVADSGNTISNHSCGQCGSLLYRTSTGYPGLMVIKAGCIDGVEDPAKTFVPTVETFTRSRVPWVPAIEGAKQEWADFTN